MKNHIHKSRDKKKGLICLKNRDKKMMQKDSEFYIVTNGHMMSKDTATNLEDIYFLSTEVLKYVTLYNTLYTWYGKKLCI